MLLGLHTIGAIVGSRAAEEAASRRGVETVAAISLGDAFARYTVGTDQKTAATGVQRADAFAHDVSRREGAPPVVRPAANRTAVQPCIADRVVYFHSRSGGA